MSEETPLTGIEAVFDRILKFAFGLVSALLAGLFGAPLRALRPSEVSVRRALSEEVVEVRHRVLRQDRPRSTAVFAGDSDPGTRHWVAEKDGEVIGVVSVMEQDGLQLRGMAVLSEYQGLGVGGALLEQVHAEVDAPMWCNARERAAKFYEQHGWAAEGDSFEIAPIGPHHKMRWAPR